MLPVPAAPFPFPKEGRHKGVGAEPAPCQGVRKGLTTLYPPRYGGGCGQILVTQCDSTLEKECACILRKFFERGGMLVENFCCGNYWPGVWAFLCISWDKWKMMADANKTKDINCDVLPTAAIPVTVWVRGPEKLTSTFSLLNSTTPWLHRQYLHNTLVFTSSQNLGAQPQEQWL